MKLSSKARKVLLTAHVATSVGWIGALAVFLAHAVASRSSQDPQVIRAAAMGMAISAWFVILPLSIGTLVTGVAQALGTAWGLLRHYWIVFKLALTLIATGVLLLKLGPISELAAASAQQTFAAGDMAGLQISLLLHAVGGLVILLLALVLAIFKPTGVTTPRGESGSTSMMERYMQAPRWARAAMIALALALLGLLAMLALGNHGPSAHLH
jgi:hypothetical protein